MREHKNAKKNILKKFYTLNWSEGYFVIKKVKSTVAWTYVTEDFSSEEIIGTFFEKDKSSKSNTNQKTNQADFRIKKIIKKKGDKLNVNWKGCESLYKKIP